MNELIEYLQRQKEYYESKMRSSMESTYPDFAKALVYQSKMVCIEDILISIEQNFKT
jgi:hypothetical protein